MADVDIGMPFEEDEEHVIAKEEHSTDNGTNKDRYDDDDENNSIRTAEGEQPQDSLDTEDTTNSGDNNHNNSDGYGGGSSPKSVHEAPAAAVTVERRKTTSRSKASSSSETGLHEDEVRDSSMSYSVDEDDDEECHAPQAVNHQQQRPDESDSAPVRLTEQPRRGLSYCSSSSCGKDDDPFGIAAAEESMDLEDRVHDLEMKLSALSRLLQQGTLTTSSPSIPSLAQRCCHGPAPLISSLRSISPPPCASRFALPPSPPSPPPPPPSDNNSAIPYLDSPAPLGHTPGSGGGERPNHPRKRNLSFRLLYDDSMPYEQSVERMLAISMQQQQMEYPPHQEHQAEQREQHQDLQNLEREIPFAPAIIREGSMPSGSAHRHSFRDTSQAMEKTQLLHDQVADAETRVEDRDKEPHHHDAGAGDAKQDQDEPQENDGDEDSRENDPCALVRNKWFDYLNSMVQESTLDVDLQMEEFIRVPSAVESLLMYGFWISVDSFLYVVTILPIRFIWSCFLWLLRCTLFLYIPLSKQGPFRFQRRHFYQLLQVFIVYSVYRYVLLPIDVGRLYHWIRGQAMLKVYVLIAIVEVFDRLLCALGQDSFDSLYWNTTRRPRSWRMMISVIVVLVYTTVHTLLLFVHVATLNVAMNSSDQALLTLLISGNFAEIKSTVFKKYNRANLFKIAASDICERFKLLLFLSLVLLLNMCQGLDAPMRRHYYQMCGIVYFAELLADWIKHSFITKFNTLPSSVFSTYALLLAGDVTGFGHEGVNLDHSHAVVRRLGLAQVPLVCVMARYVREAARFAQPSIWNWWRTHSTNPNHDWLLVVAITMGVWFMLFLTKIALGLCLQRMSHAKLHAAPELSSNTTTTKTKLKQS